MMHKYGLELVHKQIRGVFEFKYEPLTKERLIWEYLEKVDSCTGCIHKPKEGENYPLECGECSRFYGDRWENSQ